MTDTRSSSALFKRAEQLKRWEESDTNKQSPAPKTASRIQFASGIVFLAACAAGDKEEVQRLLKMGADINTANVDGLTALHQACIDNHFEMVEFLVTHGADVNRGDNEGWTPLHATASCGFLSIARYLLENGADVGAVNYDGELAVDLAESDDMLELLQHAIKEKGINCEESRNAEINHLLRDAKTWAANGYEEVRDLVNGGTPLHVAAAKGYTTVAKILLEECNVDPDALDVEGWTPLHAAALWGHKEAAALLLQYGADPAIKTASGKTCMDLADPDLADWLAEATMKASPRRVNNNNNKRKLSPPHRDSQQVELKITRQSDPLNDKAPAAPEIITKLGEGKPPKGRAGSPERAPPPPAEGAPPEEPPSWRRTASLRARTLDLSRDNAAASENESLRRTHSFENDKTFYQRYRDVTARIKASSCPSIQPLPPTPVAALPRTDTNHTAETNEDVHTRVGSTDRIEKEIYNYGPAVRSPDPPEANSNSSSPTTPSAATPTKLSPGNIFKNFFKSFVPPVRDEESETQRKAHAKRVRETRRSTQGVTLEEIKSAEQLVKKKAGNGSTDSATPTPAKSEENNTESTTRSASGGGESPAPAAAATATATIAAASERRPSWRLRLDPTNKFELEDAAATPRGAAETTVTLPLRRPPPVPPSSPSAPPTAPPTTPPATPPKDDVRTGNAKGDEDKEKEADSSSESKSSSTTSSGAPSGGGLNVYQRRRRPKRRSTGVGQVDMNEIINDLGAGGEGSAETENTPQSGNERTGEGEEPDYKALYEASASEVRRLRSLLATSEQQLREARATITRLTQVSQSSQSDNEKRERRALERKLSEMEEELKQLQKLKAENERLRAENGALTRVVSKLTNSAAK